MHTNKLEEPAGAATSADESSLQLETPADDRISNLLSLFPEVRTEGSAIDFGRLRLALGDAIDTGRERYGMTWPGRADCFRAIQTPSIATLRPADQEGVRAGTSGNLVIEGDNLEALKLLQKSYTGKVKAIYIDPPYNTGHDFVYTDNFDEPLRAYLELTGQVDDGGKRLSTNTDSDGRFHSNWLNMMYPRLYLARNLLREDGVVFISIDDTELKDLQCICDEIFGEDNRVGVLIHQRAGDATPRRHPCGRASLTRSSCLRRFVAAATLGLQSPAQADTPWRPAWPARSRTAVVSGGRKCPASFCAAT